MALYDVFARAVALVGAGAIRWRRLQGTVRTPAVGTAPAIPAAKPQGRIPTLKMPTARGWPAGADAGRGARPQGQRLRHRPRSIRAGSTCCRTATCSSAEALAGPAGRSRSSTTRCAAR